MIDLVYFTEHIRCHRDGRVEKFYIQNCKWGRKGWNVVANTDSGDGYNRIGVDGKLVLRHRMIGFCFHGLNIDDPSEMVDHISRDRGENTADNLRVVTNQQNLFNTNAKGYSWNKSSGKWRAQIKIDGRDIYLGRFDNEEDAHQAYLTAKRIYHII